MRELPDEPPVSLRGPRSLQRPHGVAPAAERAPIEPVKPAASRALSISAFLLHMLRYLRPYWVGAAVVFMGLLLEMGFTGLVPISFKFLIDEALPPKSNANLLVTILASLSVGVVVVSAIGLWRDYLYARIGARVLNDIRLRMFEHLQRLSMDFYARTPIGDIVSRFSGDVAAVEQAVAAAIPWAILPTLDLLFSTGLMFWLDFRLALVAMLAWPLCLAGPRVFTPRASRASYLRRQAEAATVTAVQEAMDAQAVVKVFSLEKPSLRGFRERLERLSGSAVRVSFLSALVDRSAGIGILMLQVAIMGVGTFLCFRGQISLGALVSFQTLFMTMSYSLLYVVQYVPNLVHGAGGLSRVEELIAEKPLVGDARAAGDLPEFAREIRFESVVFGYSGAARNLNGLSFTIRRGESVAFVGPSGSGKSTVLKLLTRLYDPNQGHISVDGHDLREVTQESWRSQIGVVFQDSFLFDMSIRENIRMGRPGASDADVLAAARAAELHELVEQLPEGYDTVVGERGGRLSGGQRQRVAIARALIRAPSLLVLDEATAALDARTEAAINATLEQAGKGRTVIAVTHRLASVVNADRIFVLDHGRLVEQGTHAELLERGGVYRQLWEKQSGFSISPDARHASLDVKRLRAIPLVQSLEDAALARLARLFVTEHFAADLEVFAEGHHGDKFYIIARGSVVATINAEREQRQISVIEEGDYFGEIALLEDTTRSATIRTRTDCLFLTLHGEHFLRLLEEMPHVRATIERVARERALQRERVATLRPPKG